MSDRLFLDAADVRQRFAGRMAQLSTTSPTATGSETTVYTESPKVLGPEGDGTEVANKRFSILMTKESALGNMGRAGPSNDYLVRLEQSITLRVQYVLRPNSFGDQLTDYDRAVGPEARALLAWMLATGAWCLGIHPIGYDDCDRRILRDGRVLIVDNHFTAQHNAQLTG